MYRFEYIKEVDKWAVINENGDPILYAQTREQVQKLVDDLNKA